MVWCRYLLLHSPSYEYGGREDSFAVSCKLYYSVGLESSFTSISGDKTFHPFFSHSELFPTVLWRALNFVTADSVYVASFWKLVYDSTRECNSICLNIPSVFSPRSSVPQFCLSCEQQLCKNSITAANMSFAQLSSGTVACDGFFVCGRCKKISSRLWYISIK